MARTLPGSEFKRFREYRSSLSARVDFPRMGYCIFFRGTCWLGIKGREKALFCGKRAGWLGLYRSRPCIDPRSGDSHRVTEGYIWYHSGQFKCSTPLKVTSTRSSFLCPDNCPFARELRRDALQDHSDGEFILCDESVARRDLPDDLHSRSHTSCLRSHHTRCRSSCCSC